jgi:3-oxoacyl-[acyl-carrier-protein] synthase II
MTNSLATKFNDRPQMASRPYDLDRDGNVVGEGAGALFIETRAHAQKRGAKAYATMCAYRNASAGSGRRYSHDNPELDHRPAARAIAGTIQDAGWSPNEVGLVNANGSSSVLYDRLEGAALGEVFGETLPEIPVHSIKSMLGQHGAGSSALQAISACLAIAESRIPPTINHEKPDPACGPLNIVTKSMPLDNPRVVTHSIGMGGFYYSAAAFESVS